jgi:RimJ/RimL family protein N-acetyltransferase
MASHNSGDHPITAQDFLGGIGVDFRSLPDSIPHPYDPDFFQITCGDHDGYVLHPVDSTDPDSVLDIAEAVFRLVEADNDRGIDDHYLGTLSDDYTSIGELIESMQHPSPLIRDVGRHVICGASEGIIGRLDCQPALIRSDVSPEMEVTLWLADPYRRNNIASYVLNRFTTDIFHERDDLLVLRAQVLVGNIAARELVKQAGFQKAGLIYDDDEEPFQDYELPKPSNH